MQVRTGFKRLTAVIAIALGISPFVRLLIRVVTFLLNSVAEAIWQPLGVLASCYSKELDAAA